MLFAAIVAIFTLFLIQAGCTEKKSNSGEVKLSGKKTDIKQVDSSQCVSCHQNADIINTLEIKPEVDTTAPKTEHG